VRHWEHQYQQDVPLEQDNVVLLSKEAMYASFHTEMHRCNYTVGPPLYKYLESIEYHWNNQPN
jgi:hypothetical protein